MSAMMKEDGVEIGVKGATTRTAIGQGPLPSAAWWTAHVKDVVKFGQTAQKLSVGECTEGRRQYRQWTSQLNLQGRRRRISSWRPTKNAAKLVAGILKF